MEPQNYRENLSHLTPVDLIVFSKSHLTRQENLRAYLNHPSTSVILCKHLFGWNKNYFHPNNPSLKLKDNCFFSDLRDLRSLFPFLNGNPDTNPPKSSSPSKGLSVAHRVFLRELVRPSDLIFPPPAVLLLGVSWGMQSWNGHLCGND